MPQSNIYSASAEEVHELFGDYLDGSGSCVVLALSERPLDETARTAIARSLDSFGYGADACLFATLLPIDPAVEGGEVALDAQALFLLVEGLDPVCVISCDAASCEALGQAYRVTFELDAPARVFGRPAVAFRDLSALLASDDGKQRAWRILKALPKR